MTREVPTIVTAWTAGPPQKGKSTKRYVSKRSAYYALAKKLVLAKYPPGIAEIAPDEHDLARWQMRIEVAEARCEKARALFFSTSAIPDEAYDGREVFDDRKWKRFIRRVAKFLAFVDERSDPRSVAELDAQATILENALVLLSTEHTRVKRIIERREAHVR